MGATEQRLSAGGAMASVDQDAGRRRLESCRRKRAAWRRAQVQATALTALLAMLLTASWVALSNAFSYPELEYSEPYGGPGRGGTQVTIFGSNFYSSQTSVLACAFGDEPLVVARVITSEQITCDVRPRFVGFTSIDVAINNVTSAASTLQYEYADAPLTAHIFPSQGAAGTLTVVRGKHFQRTDADRATFCSFGGVDVGAHFVSSEVVMCETPNRPTGTVMLDMTKNMQDYSTSRIPYMVVEQGFRIASMSPTSGPETGGTRLSSRLMAVLPESTRVRCRLAGNLQVAASISTSLTHMECLLPAHVSGLHQVAFATNEKDFYYNALYRMRAPPDELILTSEEGTVQGGTILHLSTLPHTAPMVHPLSSITSCRFGTQTVGAQPSSDGQSLQCRSPPFDAGFAAVMVSSNGFDFTLGPVFHFRQASVIDMLQPRLASDYGGGVLNVLGSDMVHTGLQCLFGILTTTAKPVSSALVQCASPGMPAGLTYLELASHGSSTVSTASPADTRMPFFVHVAPEVTAISPISGDPDGGTLVTVLGAHYVNSIELGCAFGTVSPVAAAWLEHSEMQCVSPARVLGSPEVRVTNNGIQFEGAEEPDESSVFTYIGEPGLPSSVSIDAILAGGASGGSTVTGSTGGGTPVTIVGSGFTDDVSQYNPDGSYAGGGGEGAPSSGSPSAGADVFCNFGSSVVPGTVVDSTTIICETPSANGGGFTTVELVDGDGVVSATSSEEYLYSELPEVHGISPLSGSVAGGTRVVVVGENFSPSESFCRFGASRIELAQVLSSTLLTCVSPAHTHGKVHIGVSNNAHDWSVDDFVFNYQSPPKIFRSMPRSGPESGGTHVEILGADFKSTSSFVAKVGSLGPMAVAVGTSHVANTHTPASVPQSAAVRVSSNMIEFDHEIPKPVYFEYLRNMTVDSAFPSAGMIGAPLAITVVGTNVDSTGKLWCRSGEASGGRISWAGDGATCSILSHHAGFAAIGVSNNGADYVVPEQDVAFEFAVSSTLSSLSTKMTHNGTILGIRGANFKLGALCTMNERVSSAAHVISSAVIACEIQRIPTMHVHLRMTSSNSAHSTDGFRVFHQLDFPEVQGAYPSGVTGEGGSPISVYGVYPPTTESSYCRVGTISPLFAGRTAPDAISCVSPALSPRFAPVEVSINGFEYTADEMSLRVHSSPTVEGLLDVGGLSSGGTQLRMAVDSFAASDIVRCIFNGMMSPAQYGGGLLKCVTPAHSPGFVEVHISRQGSSTLTTGAIFQFHVSPKLLYLDPAIGPSAGGSVLALVGEHFLSTDTTCAIGDKILSTRIVSSSLACVESQADVQGKAAASLMLGGDQVFSNAAQSIFTHAASPRVLGVTPAAGESSGGSILKLAYAQAHRTGMSAAACAVGSFAPVMAARTDDDDVECVAPARSAGRASLRLADNHKDFDGSSSTFEYVDSNDVLAVIPSVGLSRGGTIITVYPAKLATGSSTRLTVHEAQRSVQRDVIEISLPTRQEILLGTAA
eukprot:PRCOL_00000805-RA